MDAIYDKEGRELPDPTPIEIPVGYAAPESLQEMIARMVQCNEIKNNQDIDSEEEANDFNVMDEEPVDSRHEYSEMHEEFIKTEDHRIKAAVEKDDNSEHPETETQVKRPKKTGKKVQPEPEQENEA